MSQGRGLDVLVVDDEKPALDELSYLLARDDRIGTVTTCQSATDGLRILRETEVDCVFLDIKMPGLSGIEFAEVLGRFKEPPPVVFVTAHDQHAIDAFAVDAVDYLLKPVRADRLAEAIRRVVGGSERERSDPTTDLQVPVERGGVTRFINRSDITHVVAQGDYARLHTIAGDSYLVRTPLTTLEEDWRTAGFWRIHRSMLVSLAHIGGVRIDAGKCTVLVGDAELPVARRHTRELRDVLTQRARTGTMRGE